MLAKGGQNAPTLAPRSKRGKVSGKLEGRETLETEKTKQAIWDIVPDGSSAFFDRNRAASESVPSRLQFTHLRDTRDLDEGIEDGGRQRQIRRD